MLWDRDLMQFRQTYYRLFVKLLWKEPEAAFIAALRDDDVQARGAAAAALHPLMGSGWQVIDAYLAEHRPAEAAAEFSQLFLEPFARVIRPYASYYLTGQFFTEPLKTWRGFLKHLAVEKPSEGFSDPEDVLAFELDVMRWLIDKQAAADDVDRWLRLQATCLKEHLLVWAPSCAADIEQAPQAAFYRGAAQLLRGFLEVEQSLFRDWGLDKVATLAEARAHYGARPAWRGPLFDAADEEVE
jgi:TorA maturation chaperone TorD